MERPIQQQNERGTPEVLDSWDAWFKEHGAALALFARQWLPDFQDAEDAVQEGFVRFWQSRRRAGGAPEVANLRAYLYACVKNCALDALRMSRRRRRREETAACRRREEILDWFDAGVERAERAGLIEAALRRLSLKQREVLVLKIWGNLTFPEIGAVLEASHNTIASRYRYALIELKNLLRKEPLQ